MGQASPESSWTQASWGDKEGKGAYKRGGGVQQEMGFKKIKREDLEK